MRSDPLVIALDLSSSTGYAEFKDGRWSRRGTLELSHALGLTLEEGRSIHWLTRDLGKYPWSYLARGEMVASAVAGILPKEPYVAVIEETNGGGRAARWSQKMLEFIHNHVLRVLGNDPLCIRVDYVSSSDWRSELEVRLSKEDKAQNAKLAKAKRDARKKGKKVDKKAVGIAGKVTIKHKAVQFVNAAYGLTLKIGDNDQADALCLGEAYLRGAPLSAPGSAKDEA